MIREDVGNTVVRFYSDKNTAAKVASVMEASVREYQASGRFFLASKVNSSEVFDESGRIFHPKSLKENSKYTEDFNKLMNNSNIVV